MFGASTASGSDAVRTRAFVHLAFLVLCHVEANCTSGTSVAAMILATLDGCCFAVVARTNVHQASSRLRVVVVPWGARGADVRLVSIASFSSRLFAVLAEALILDTDIALKVESTIAGVTQFCTVFAAILLLHGGAIGAGADVLLTSKILRQVESRSTSSTSVCAMGGALRGANCWTSIGATALVSNAQHTLRVISLIACLADFRRVDAAGRSCCRRTVCA